MQETEFIAQNREKWKEFEDVLKSTNKDPDRLTNLFIETTDDLSYSRTHYSNRSVRVYLNGIAQQVYQAIYRNRSKQKHRARTFWRTELPAVMWHNRRALLVAFLLFAGGLAIGMFSSIHYPDFARIILGDMYVEMTEANIESGDPMAVYQDDEPVEMFLRIALNNIRVSFMAFVLGITFAIGTYYLLLYNGIMVGAFLFFFIERDLFREAFLAVMLHGTLELSMIVLSGCAGLVLARGLLFPGTYTRMQALVLSARDGIRIMIAVSIFLVYAAVIESFATRFTSLPGVDNGQLILDVLRAIVILISFTIVLGYFVVYPWYLHRKGAIAPAVMEDPPIARMDVIDTTAIKSAGTIFTEAFFVFSRTARPLAMASLLLSLAAVAVFGWIVNGKYDGMFDVYDEGFNPAGPLWVWEFFNYPLDFERYPLAFPLLVAVMTLWIFFTASLYRRAVHAAGAWLAPRHWANTFTASVLLSLPLLLPHGFTVLVMSVWFPFVLFWYMTTIEQDGFLAGTIGRTLSLLRGNMGRWYSTFLLLLSIQWLSFILLYGQLAWWLLLDFIRMNLPHHHWLSEQLPYAIFLLLITFIPCFMFSLTVTGMGLFYHSAREINEAPALRGTIEKLGTKRRAYGMEQEG